MNSRTILLTVLLAILGGVAGLSGKPAITDIAKAGALAAQIKTPDVRAALQCRVAFADTTATVPIKSSGDKQGAGVFWATYVKKIRGIDVAACPEGFKNAFDKHLRTVESVSASLNNPSTRMSSNPPKVVHTARNKGSAIIDAAPIGGDIKGHHDALGDCVETYRAVFAAANKSMKTAPAGDGQLAGQIDGLLKD